MGKKMLKGLFVLVVLLMGAALAVGILFAGPAPAGANEVLAKAPALTDRDGNFNTNILSDTSDWLTDRFFGRQWLISMNNFLTGTLFGNSATDDVILGEDGWLYYASTLPDYTGTAPMTDRELFMAANNLQLMADYCAENGRQFAFMIAPNKNSLYPEQMPNYGVSAETKNAQRLQETLAALDVAYIDLFTLFDRPETLYFAHDSHWNSRGAALGADGINQAFGVQSNYFGDPFAESIVHQGDLYEMLYPAFQDNERDPVYGGQLVFEYTSGATKPDSITLLTQGQGSRSLLCYRDSFGNLLYPYLADSSSDARFSRSTSYDLTQPGDHVLIELVERNLSYLYTYLPVMPASARQLELPAAGGAVALSVQAAKTPESTQLVKGTLTEETDANSGIYIVCDGGIYEAFCLANGGFGAYVPADQNPTGVAFYQNGALCYRTAE